MNRSISFRTWIIGLASIVILVSAGIAAPTSMRGKTKSDIPPHVTHGPILGRLTDTSVGVWIRTSLPTKFRIRYGTDAARMDLLSAFGTTELEHDNTGWLELTGLQPDTLYTYRVEAPQSTLPDSEQCGTFRTMPSAKTYYDAKNNPRGLFNFRFEIGACASQLKGTATSMPSLRTMLDRHAGQILFGFRNGDWIYEEARARPLTDWLRSQEISADAAPEIVKAAPAITGVWRNYQLYLERSANLREWHRNVPSFFLFDDHELLGDIDGVGNIGFRNRRAVFRDVGIQAWNDYVGWSNPRQDAAPIVFGQGQMEAGSDILRDTSGSLPAGFDPSQAGSLMVLWGGPHAGENDDQYDDVGGDPNAGIYEIRENLGDGRLRVFPAAKSSGPVSYSIGRPQYTSFRVGNCEFFVVDTRSYRQLHDMKNPFDPKVEFLGKRQKEWLKERMRASDADFLFVVSGVSVMLPHLEPRAKTAADANENDAWSAAGAEREEMIKFWDSLKKPVLLMTGDIHDSFAIKVTDGVWEFLAAPVNSHQTFASDAGNPPATGPFTYLNRTVDIRWSMHVPEDTPAPRYHPIYSLVQVNNVYECPGPDAGRRWAAFPRPQVIVQFYDGRTGELMYAESIVANR